ncbi:MAG: winged helix-turn-helix transcriptional regulator [Chloroflexi bacterium]|nr:winged helix-turn-helix transcriptional regulator [Chloroflexota bacterium]
MRDLIVAIKALSDETRLRMMKLLLERGCCVCEVMQALEISQSRASRNLGILQNAGFLKARRDRLWTVYYIDWGAAGHAPHLARLLQQLPIDDETLRADRERLKRSSPSGPGCREERS